MVVIRESVNSSVVIRRIMHSPFSLVVDLLIPTSESGIEVHISLLFLEPISNLKIRRNHCHSQIGKEEWKTIAKVWRRYAHAIPNVPVVPGKGKKEQTLIPLNCLELPVLQAVMELVNCGCERQCIEKNKKLWFSGLGIWIFWGWAGGSPPLVAAKSFRKNGSQVFVLMLRTRNLFQGKKPQFQHCIITYRTRLFS